MRRFAALLIATAGVALVASRGSAAGPDTPLPVEPPKGAPTLEPRLQPPPYIAAARRAPAKGLPGTSAGATYREGPIDYELEIVNPTTSELETNLIVERLDVPAPLPRIATVPVKVPAGGHDWVAFADPQGLKDGCTPTRHRVQLESGTSTRTLETRPTCSFAADARDPLASLSPERRAEARRGRLSYHSAALASPLACGAPFVVRAVARNDASTAAQDARLRLDGPNTDATTSFELGAGKERALTVTIPSFLGVPGPYALRVDASVPVYQPGFGVRVTRSCRLDVALER